MTLEVLDRATKTRRAVPEKDASTGTRPGHMARVILFNDDVHTFDDVASQLVKAVRCTYQRGLALANVVHNAGSAMVYEGHLERCEAVAMVLGEIALKTAIER